MNDPLSRQKMYKLGMAMRSYASFYWVGILLCWLIVPAIILFVRYIKYLTALNDVKNVNNDPNLNTGIILLWTSLGINIALALIGTADEYLTFLGLAGYIVSFIGYIKIEGWAETVSLQRNSPQFLEFKAGLNTIKVGNLLSVIIIGIFIIPGGFSKCARALMIEFGDKPILGYSMPAQININVANVQNAPPQQQYVPQQQYPPQQQYVPQQQYPPQQPYTPQQPYVPPQPTMGDSQAYQPQISNCPHCGALIPSPDTKFCSSCGQPVK